MRSQSLKIWLAMVWLLFTTAMVVWWWNLVLSEIQDPSKYRMVVSEGVFFFVAVLLGGGSLIYLLAKDQARHLQLKNFFNLFSHDLKTSISRLRLQSEILKEDQLEKIKLWKES
jgi:signal transduction histidine kinase